VFGGVTGVPIIIIIIKNIYISGFVFACFLLIVFNFLFLLILSFCVTIEDKFKWEICSVFPMNELSCK